MSLGFKTCGDCGEIVSNARSDEHECDPERLLSFQTNRAQAQSERIDQELARYLETTRGKFELWYAERTRLRGA